MHRAEYAPRDRAALALVAAFRLAPRVMTRYPHPIIAREGWPFLLIAFAVALALSFAGWWVLAVLAWIAFLFILQFFRDPPREVPTQPNAVLSPADGRIVRIGNVRDAT